MLVFTFACPLPNGVHARPASALEEQTRRFASGITLLNERTGQQANAKSILAIVGLDIRHADVCRLAVSGADEGEATETLRQFLEHEFPHCDQPIEPVQAGAGSVTLPRLLAEAGARLLTARPVARGIGRGHAVRMGAFVLPGTVPTDGVADADAEIAILDAALAALGGRFEEEIRGAGTAVQAGVLEAQRAIVRDPEFRDRLAASVRQRHRTAAGAIVEAERHFSALLLATGSAVLRERALDIQDVCRALHAHIYGAAAADPGIHLSRDSVCLARALTPGQFLGLDRRWLKGLVLAEGGATSHTVILARSFGIPALAGLDRPEEVADGSEVIVDADLGVLVADLTDSARRYYAMESARIAARAAHLERSRGLPADTVDGRRLEIGANIGAAFEAAAAFRAGADGIGLFRTEMLFADRDAPPSEDEQVEEYHAAAAAGGDRPVIVRTLDAGGDKPIPYLRLPAEGNPFLGCRAVRLYPGLEALFRTQVRAILRASALGRLRLMVPMIARVEEARWVGRIVAEERQRLAAAGIAHDPDLPVGAMVEVPSAAYALDRLAGEFNFFSIGTNDLLQYFSAADRTNPALAAFHDPTAPPFLRLLRGIVADARALGRWIGLCGEMGGEPRCLPLLVGLGLDEISVAAPAIAQARSRVRGLSFRACRDLLDRAVSCATAAEVHELLKGFEGVETLPLVDPDLVVLDSDARTKAEAIKEAVDRLYVVGRTDQPREIEEAVWRREATYSTGFGHGLAIPHAKIGAVTANSLVVTRLKTPVEWGALDGQPVRMLLLLAIRESDQATAHMRVLAALSRRLMHEQFRAQLVGEQDPAALCRIIGGVTEENREQ